jgi:hypothetical protein
MSLSESRELPPPPCPVAANRSSVTAFTVPRLSRSIPQSGSVVAYDFDGENSANRIQGQSSGEGTYAYSGDIYDSTFRNMISGPIVTGDPAATKPQIVSGCEIGPTYMSFDPGSHPDGIFMNGGNLFHWHDNYFHDNYVLSVFVGNGSGNERTYLWNNVIYSAITQSPIVIDGRVGTSGKVFIWNNTLVGDRFTAVRVSYRPGEGGAMGLLEMRNNLILSDAGILTIDQGNSITTFINEKNLVLNQSQAQAADYLLSNRYRPNSSAAPSVGYGADLSTIPAGVLLKDILGVTRPQGQGWDVGAYEFMSAEIPLAPPTGLRIITVP